MSSPEGSPKEPPEFSDEQKRLLAIEIERFNEAITPSEVPNSIGVDLLGQSRRILKRRKDNTDGSK